MAVAAARDCLVGMDKKQVDGLYLASTTFPFADRLNSGIVATALNLREDIFAADFTASQRAGTSALIAALEAVQGGKRRTALVVAADRREARAASHYELWFGDGAAALLVGSENVIARFVGAHTLTADFGTTTGARSTALTTPGGSAGCGTRGTPESSPPPSRDSWTVWG
jgi:3-hydroxy-3-methylglutaryl CoA synthase